jgi:hypothetical protein
MQVIAQELLFDGIQRRRPGQQFEWPLATMPVISSRQVKPVDPADQEEFDRLCLPVNQRPKIDVKKLTLTKEQKVD